MRTDPFSRLGFLERRRFSHPRISTFVGFLSWSPILFSPVVQLAVWLELRTGSPFYLDDSVDLALHFLLSDIFGCQLKVFRRLSGAHFHGAEHYEVFGQVMSCQRVTIATLGLILFYQQLHVVEGSVVFVAFRNVESVFLTAIDERGRGAGRHQTENCGLIPNWVCVCVQFIGQTLSIPGVRHEVPQSQSKMLTG